MVYSLFFFILLFFYEGVKRHAKKREESGVDEDDGTDMYSVLGIDPEAEESDIKKVYELANKGFSIFAVINPAVAGGFEHQGYFALIDKNGYIRSRVDRFDNPIVYYSGLDKEGEEIQDVDLLIEDIALLLKE